MTSTKSSILVIGSGGREHAMATSLSLSSHVGTIFCAPGNAGMANVGTVVDLNISNHAEVIHFIQTNKIKLTVIGPEAPLVDGLSDALRAEGHLVVGASKKAAMLEGSKIFAKKFMTKFGIPTADFKEFSDSASAKAFVATPEGKKFRVLKADGLAAGKGVFVTETQEEMIQAITQVLDEKKFGLAGKEILIEETLSGPEVSVIALTDGKTVLPFPAAQDHKRALDNDEGPNTGGMGVYAPTSYYDFRTRMAVEKEIFDSFLRGLAAEKLDFRGIIYFGLMLTEQGPKVLEFNVRFGDPEAQAVLPLIESDLYEAFLAVAKGELANVNLQKKQAYSCAVVMASGGYPNNFENGFPIAGLDEVEKKESVYLFHAGTKKTDGKFVTHGGRVLSVVGVGKELDIAVVKAYQGVKKISFKNAHFRNDIAGRALKNKNITNRIRRMKKRYSKETTLLQA